MNKSILQIDEDIGVTSKEGKAIAERSRRGRTTPCGEIQKGQSHVWQGQGTESLPSESALNIHH